jgi:hypothetical protein
MTTSDPFLLRTSLSLLNDSKGLVGTTLREKPLQSQEKALAPLTTLSFSQDNANIPGKQDGRPTMTFDEILAQTCTLLQREGRVSYRALKRRLALNDEDLEDLKSELIDAKRLASDEDGKVLVWTGASLVSGSKFQVSSSQHPTPSTSIQVEAEGERV